MAPDHKSRPPAHPTTQRHQRHLLLLGPDLQERQSARGPDPVRRRLHRPHQRPLHHRRRPAHRETRPQAPAHISHGPHARHIHWHDPVPHPAADLHLDTLPEHLLHHSVHLLLCRRPRSHSLCVCQ